MWVVERNHDDGLVERYGRCCFEGTAPEEFPAMSIWNKSMFGQFGVEAMARRKKYNGGCHPSIHPSCEKISRGNVPTCVLVYLPVLC